MSGTAAIDEVEFKEVYNLDLVIIPRHSENKRMDHDDAFFTEASYKEQFL